MKMTNKVYDVLKYIAQIALPAIGAFYVTVAGIWHLPYPEEIGGTILALDTMLGALLMISKNNYDKTNQE